MGWQRQKIPSSPVREDAEPGQGDFVSWFERLTGFVECGYDATREQLEIDGKRLRSRVNGRCCGIGDLELVSLAELRRRAREGPLRRGRSRVRVVRGDVRHLHRHPEFSGALFQVASQFNLLEMTGPDVTPEHGVTRYAFDHTQGPACAIAAGGGNHLPELFCKGR